MPAILTKIVRRLVGRDYHVVPDIYGRSAAKMVDIRSHEPFFSIAKTARENGRTLLYFDRLYTLYQAIENLRGKKDKVRTIEIGAYKGGGSYFMAKAAQTLLTAPIEHYVVDTFEGHSTKDLPTGAEGGHTPGMFDATEYTDVLNYLKIFPFVKTIQGRIQDVTTAIPESFDFIHLDVDIYEPTIFSLRQFGERMPLGGMIVVDDYGFTTCPGIRKAVEEYLVEHPSIFTRFELLTGQCVLIKVQ